MVRDVQVSDGYDEIVDEKELEDARVETAADDAVRMWQAGLNPGFSQVEQKYIEGYLSGR